MVSSFVINEIFVMYIIRLTLKSLTPYLNFHILFFSSFLKRKDLFINGKQEKMMKQLARSIVRRSRK